MNSTEALVIIDRIAAAKGNAKLDILEELLADPFGVKVAQYAYDPFITYGITPKKPKDDKLGVSFDLSSKTIFDVLDQLAARKLTGNLALETAEACYIMLNSASAELLWRILSKDFRAGVTAKSINTIRPGTIMTFEVMLSHKLEERYVKTFPVAMEPKLDGLRAPCLVKNGQGKFFSRVGNHFPALDDLGALVADVVQRLFDELKDHTVLLPIGEAMLKMMGGREQKYPTLAIEGEVLSGMFAESSGTARRKSEKATAAEFHFFDVVPFKIMTNYQIREFKVSGSLRRVILEHIAGGIKLDEPMILVPRCLANSHEEIQTIYEKYRNTPLATYLARGDVEKEKQLLLTLVDANTNEPKMLEGAMVKSLEGFYEKKRSRTWLKMKAEMTDDLRVVSLFEGNGKYIGQMGGFVCDLDGVDVRIGGGFSDAQRIEYWNNPSLAIGRLAEIEYHEKTPDKSLRHPRFLRWRNDKDEKLRAA